MTLEQAATWGSFTIPLILLGMSAVIQRIVDGGDFKRDHFYLGLDLTVYFLASTMINCLDIAKRTPLNAMSVVWTIFLLVFGLIVLFIQMGLHQKWAASDKFCRMQMFMLCFLSNGLGVIILYGFIRCKTKGLI